MFSSFEISRFRKNIFLCNFFWLASLMPAKGVFHQDKPMSAFWMFLKKILFYKLKGMGQNKRFHQFIRFLNIQIFASKTGGQFALASGGQFNRRFHQPP